MDTFYQILSPSQAPRLPSHYSHTSLLQIEAGHRAVNTLELVQLSRLYHYDLTRLVAEEDAEEEEDKHSST